MERFFVSDLHLGHKNILPTRPQFTSIEEHDAYLIERWNKKVHKNDEVWILGDVSFRSPYSVPTYLSMMKGKKHLIVGNHDEDWMKKVDNLNEYFETVEYLKIIRFDHMQVTLCHYPMLEFPGSRYQNIETSYLIHGHIHGIKREDVYGYIKEYQPNALNAGVDINNFEPVTFHELKRNNDIWYEREP